jgi:hypothetical protein
MAKQYKTYDLTFAGTLTVTDTSVARKDVTIRFLVTEVGVEEAVKAGRQILDSFVTREASEALTLTMVVTQP